MAEQAQGGDVLVRFTGDSMQLEAAAAKAQAAVNRTTALTTASGSKMASATAVVAKGFDTAAASTAAMGKTSADAAKQLLNLKLVVSERLAPAIGMISPQAGMAMQGIGRLAAMSSVLAGAIVPLGAVLAAGATAWTVWGAATADARVRAEGLDREIERLQRGINPEIMKAAASATKAWNATMLDLETELLVLSGDLDDYEVKALAYIAQRQAAAEATRYESGMLLANAIALQLNLRARMAHEKVLSKEWEATRTQVDALHEQIAAAKDAMQAAEAQNDASMDNLTTLLLDIAAKKQATDASRARTKAVKDESAAIEELRADLGVVHALEKQWAEEERVAAEALQATIDEKEAGDAAAAAQRKADVDAYVAGWQEAAGKLISIFATLNAAEYEQKVGAVRRLEAAFRENRETMTKEERKTAKERIAAAKEAARKTFAVSKGLAMADAAVNAAKGITAIWAQWGAYPPVAIALTAIEAGMMAAQIAVIAKQKPKFHAGGLRRTPGDEVGLPGEGVINRQAVRDNGGSPFVDALNSGAVMGGGVTVIRIGRLEAREIARTDIRANGMIPTYVGRRTGRQGTAGLSDKLAVA